MSSSLLIDYSQSEPHYQLQNYAELPSKHLTPLLLAAEAHAVHKLKIQGGIEHQALLRQSDGFQHHTGLGCGQLPGYIIRDLKKFTSWQ